MPNMRETLHNPHQHPLSHKQPRLPTLQNTTQTRIHGTRHRLQRRRLGKGQLMELLIGIISLLTAVVIMLTWRLYRLEQTQYRLMRMQILNAYKDVPLFYGIDRDE